jgi:hypothetical protein
VASLGDRVSGEGCPASQACQPHRPAIARHLVSTAREVHHAEALSLYLDLDRGLQSANIGK